MGSGLAYGVDLEDIKFVLFEQLEVHKELASIDKYSGFDLQVYEATLDEAARIATEVLPHVKDLVGRGAGR